MNLEKKFKSKEKLVVAVSGGPDSMCLLHNLLKIQKKLSLTLIVAHVNYQLRGEDSNLDQELVENFCKQCNLTCFVKKVNDLTLKDSNLEEKLRKMRYDFFEEIRKKQNVDKIVLAHNEDDQAETVLMRILRGAGLRGLGGMKAKSKKQKAKLMRPFLDVSREEVLDYCKKNKVLYRIDQSNYDKKFFRNQVRHEVLPFLEKYNPEVGSNLLRLGETAGRDYDFIQETAQEKMSDVRCQMSDRQEMILDYKKWLKLEPAMQYEVLRQAINEIRGNLTGIKMVHLDEVVTMLNKNIGNKHKILPGGLKIELRDGRIKLQVSSNK